MASNKLIQELMGQKVEQPEVPQTSQLTDPVYVEKLASAVDFIADHFDSLAKVASAEPPVDPPAVVPDEPAPAVVATDLAERIRQSLQSRLQHKKEAQAAAGDSLAQAVLSKLTRMRAGVEPVEKTAAPEAPPEQPESTPAPAEEEAEVKAAHVADLSLADVLEGALRANEPDEGVPQRLKTASVRGTEGPKARKVAVETLKQGLLAAKFGKEA